MEAALSPCLPRYPWQQPSLQSRLRRASSSSSENLNPHDGFRPRLSSALSAVAPPRPSSIDGRRPRTDINLLRSDNGSILEAQGTTLANASPSLPPLSLAETAWLAAQFMVVWFGANWSINAGLGLTSVASGTTIGSASGFFTLAIGCLLGVDHFTYGRLGAVSMSFLGVLLVTWADTETNPSSTLGSPVNAPLGDALALLSAFLYSIYVMMLKVKIGSEDRISMPLFFGFVGAFNIIALWPIGLLLHLTGIEPFQLPPNAATWLGVVVNMSITFVSDLVYLLAMLKSSPLATTLGLSLTIPLALAGDILRGSHSGGLQAGLGSVMVLLSFLAIGLADNAAMQNEILAATSATHLPGPAVPLSTSASSIRSYSANGSAFTSRNSEDLSSEDEDGARLSSGDTRGRSSIRT
ncbi:hypothetical protein IE53DRAFT_402615 [Violaceomyces palustris]|uniref:Uncharacterized protein n=1 Tax=Violaceomyces palustris TaxID=1673888 RepID=A0ACD0NN78_9BASI|nr:hypothetical protein IE53DRAFT_402615 [Violaceomyces palustris]